MILPPMYSLALCGEVRSDELRGVVGVGEEMEIPKTCTHITSSLNKFERARIDW